MKNAPGMDDDLEGILVLDEDEFFLSELAAMIPDKEPEVSPKAPVKPIASERKLEVVQTPSGPSAEERERMIADWLDKNRPGKKTEKESEPSESAVKTPEIVDARPIKAVSRTPKQKKERKAKASKPPKAEKAKAMVSEVDESDEEELELEVPEKVEGEERLEADVSAVARLVNGQWKTGYDIEAAYKREIGRHDLLTIDQERDLLRRYHETKDRDAWDKLVACNQRLVAKYARYYVNTYRVPFLDAVQEGNFGLMHAIKRFSLERGSKLSTYATWWIKQAIVRWIMDTNRTVRLPVHVHDLLARARKTEMRLFRKLDREPTEEELCKELGVSIKKFKNAQEGLKKIFSMDCELGTDFDGDLLGDFIADDRPLQDETMHDQELSENVIGPALVGLKPQQRFVMVMRFGLDGVVFTEQDIASAMKIELEEVRALEMTVLQKLEPPDHVVFDRQASMEWLRRISHRVLTPREELVFILRYGIGAMESTLENIAARVSVTRERIRQIEEKTLPILRKRMEHGVLKTEKKMGIHRAVGVEAISASEAAGKGGIR